MRPEPIPAGEIKTEEEQLTWEVQAVLAWHDEDAMAAIRTLLTDCRHLREQLVLAEGPWHWARMAAGIRARG